MKLVSAIFALLLAFAPLAPAVAADPDPQQAAQLVQETADKVLERLKADRAQLKANPDRIYGIVQDLALSHFDFERMARWVLGRYWNDAKPDQQKELVEQFRTLLVRTYAKALLEYTDQKITMLPVRPGDRPDRATVRTEVSQPGGNNIGINYSLYYGDQGWKVYDVVVDGVSLVTNYRTEFADEIKRGGMDGLITHLKQMNAAKGAGK